jgi:hypothetical protein
MTDSINECDVDISLKEEQRIQTGDLDPKDSDDQVSLNTMNIICEIYHEHGK